MLGCWAWPTRLVRALELKMLSWPTFLTGWRVGSSGLAIFAIPKLACQTCQAKHCLLGNIELTNIAC